MKYLIIGGVAGGASTAARLRRMNEQAEIILFEKGKYISYANCGLPYYIGGVIEERERLFVQTPVSFHARFNIDVRVGSEVKRIDVAQKTVEVVELISGRTYYESYDKLVLSPGAEPVRPPLEGIGEEGIFTLRNVSDTDRIKEWATNRQVKRAVVVGAGFIGLEMAENLHQLGIQVTVVEMAEQVMTPVDFEIAATAHQHFKEKGVGLLLKEAVASFHKNSEGLQVALKSGRNLQADLVILSIGVRPDIRLAREAGLRIGELGGIWVNEYLQTSDPSIYAVGDAIEFKNPISNHSSLAFLAGPANKQGRICADNIVNGNCSIYKGAIGTAIAKVFDLTVGASGLSARMLERLEIPYLTTIIHASSHAGYYPNALQLTIKINFSPNSGRLLGGQVVGYEGADKRLEMLAAVIRNGGSIYDLIELEQAYAPPFSSAKDPVNMAGFVADNIIHERVKSISWRELQAMDKNKITLINVCTKDECALNTIKGSVNIPLDEIRSHWGEIPTDKPVVVFCAVGLRGYIASRVLTQHGYDVYNLTGGLKTYALSTAEQCSEPYNNEPTTKAADNSNQSIRQISVDACGLQCPGPVMKLKSGIEGLAIGERLQIRATDAGFARDVESWAKITGNKLVSLSREKGIITALLEKGGEAACNPTLKKADGKTIVVFNNDLDKALASFVIANGAASTGRKVTMFFTFWGLNVIKRKPIIPVKKDFMGKMFGMMLPSSSRKLKLSKMNMMGIGSRMMRGIMRKKQIDSLESLIEQASQNGVEFIACQMSMDVMGIKAEELLDGVRVGGVATYLERAEDANVNLFI